MHKSTEMNGGENIVKTDESVALSVLKSNYQVWELGEFLKDRVVYWLRKYAK